MFAKAYPSSDEAVGGRYFKERGVLREPPLQHLSWHFPTALSQPAQRQRISEAPGGEGLSQGHKASLGRAGVRFPDPGET